MVNIATVAKDALEYSRDLENDRLRRTKYWKLLRILNKEYQVIVGSSAEADISFAKYVEYNYGIVIHYLNGNITSDFSISNEPKYTFCLLKHG